MLCVLYKYKNGMIFFNTQKKIKIEDLELQRKRNKLNPFFAFHKNKKNKKMIEKSYNLLLSLKRHLRCNQDFILHSFMSLLITFLIELRN